MRCGVIKGLSKITMVRGRNSRSLHILNGNRCLYLEEIVKRYSIMAEGAIVSFVLVKKKGKMIFILKTGKITQNLTTF